jgi:site-specific DNA-adenine methylase
MKLRPFFCFYGGKWRAAPRYPAPQHDTIIEPFAGAAGYATRYPDRRVVLVEKDPLIAGLWRYLARVSSEEIRRLPLLGPGETVADLRICAEARSLVGFWLNKGTTAPVLSPSAWARNPRYAREFWGETVRERIAAQVAHIRHWRVVEASYSEIASPALAATWFVDPPYQRQGKYYRYSAAEIDFCHLARWCRDLRGQVLVCEQEPAAWLPFRPLAVMKANESRNGKKTSAEVLWTNAPEVTT